MIMFLKNEIHSVILRSIVHCGQILS